ncbi:PepSY-associated TM helix domain-containing protein [Rheinheimera baltica]|uniref:PepSY-associated TM helix domain-containing protein n=1 Tax=Rheinheimera baltica TaxID=67576 RepID=A0ABT9HTV1_9GAMM|nr:PepSY-associated TM helix domain-containing protein [Rheinheimera baltica]MDP5134433.1 PepSY-associated TM helix domain-containing protein [Rheinheimera baltica]MDP5141259.1 PepSY-associated TM helix domain-containing protein [Rheinheimera baltica]MDP5148488.1 PepSY-associated TM helix domain-containing protein [Rheinheimera baltica]
MNSFQKNVIFAKLVRALHSYSSMLVLVLLLFFAITGLTLNHPDVLHSKAGYVSERVILPLPEYLQLSLIPQSEEAQAELAHQFRQWLSTEDHVKASTYKYQFDIAEQLLELDFKRPGGYANVVVDFAAGQADVDKEFSGYLTLLNELHKGRNAGASWIFLIDATALACIVFALTGFYLLLKQPSRRPIGNSLAMLGVFLALFAYILSLH